MDEVISGTTKPGLLIFDKLEFDVRRFFIINGLRGEKRGQHAHKKCRQMLICLDGKVELISDTSFEITVTELNPERGRYLHNTWNWLTIKFIENSRVLVLAEYQYDEKDYIRDYNKFKRDANR